MIVPAHWLIPGAVLVLFLTSPIGLILIGVIGTFLANLILVALGVYLTKRLNRVAKITAETHAKIVNGEK